MFLVALIKHTFYKYSIILILNRIRFFSWQTQLCKNPYRLFIKLLVMKKYIPMLFVFALFFMQSCNDDPGPKYFTKDAVVIDAGARAADGCDWVISIDDSSFHPINLDDQYKINNLRIRVTYKYDETSFFCGFANMKMQSIYIKEIQVLSDDCNQFGTVYDYTGLDGCGFVIKTDDGETLEVVEVVPNFVLKDNQRVKFSYTDLQLASICMVGKTVRIDCIMEAGCTPVIQDIFNREFEDDPVYASEVFIDGDCLEIKVSYSGGCEDHEFNLIENVLRCATPPIDLRKHLWLSHDSKGDMCEALITETLSYDLSTLQDPTKNSVDIVLDVNTNNGKKTFNFVYKYE
jgi:hypothetical protein